MTSLTTNTVVITCPLGITLGGKRYSLNLNTYRNLHYQINSRLKREFCDLMCSQLNGLKPFGNNIDITYMLYTANKRLCDVRNITTIVDKFLCDALQHYSLIPDDNYNYCSKFHDYFGGIDPTNPRVEVTIKYD